MRQASRKVILDSIYTLRQRKSELLTLTNNSNNAPVKSLIQGRAARYVPSTTPTPLPTKSTQQVKRQHITNTRTSKPIAATLHPIKSFGNFLYPVSQTRSHTNRLVSSTFPSFLSSRLSQSRRGSIRQTFVSTNDNYNYDDKENRDSDLIVVLDLDECLIHSQFLKSGPDEKYRQYEERPKAHAFNSNEEADSIIPSACESFRMSLPDGDLVHVNKRPNLDTFLKEITSKYETHIFTAAMEVYASPLLDILDPNQDMFQGRYYRDHCTFDPSLGVYVKDLKNAFRKKHSQEGSNKRLNEGRVVLVDNNPMSFLANPCNGVLVSNFYDDPKDDTLQLVLDLLDQLDNEPDVRPVLRKKFGLKDALREAVAAPNTAAWN